MYCNDCSRPVEYCTCGAFSRHKDSAEEKQLREFFTKSVNESGPGGTYGCQIRPGVEQVIGRKK